MKLIGSLGALVATLMIAMKVIPFVPGSFGRYEYLALGVWIVMGFALWKRRGKSAARLIARY
jgi:hypothetical protein